MSGVVVNNLIKKYNNDVTALNHVNIDIKEGEFFALLGPSGCGKTTTMRCIAGFETPTSGEIFINGQVVNHVPANKRNCGMVFQSYALFPHYNVFENVAYGLTIRDFYQGGFGTKVSSFARLLSRRLAKPPKHIVNKVSEALDYVELGHLAERGTSELSGGQQQRVALARALVMEPSVLLMDEPLSNLDKKLRNTMRTTIRRIQQDVGITTIFVTHDQEEAMSMADRVAVMKDGEIIQNATPTELYSHPVNPFVADFVGSSNLFQGTIVERTTTGSVIQIDGFVLRSGFSKEANDMNVLIRPEGMNVYHKDTEINHVNIIEGKVLMHTYLGPNIRYDVKVGAHEVGIEKIYVPGERVLTNGEDVKVTVDPERVLLI
ncbi:ABC transporter ATP-binding protein [Alkalihalobacillus alcalophilus ATCC 27647 = CGMCC 1.3604]|uniref:ABC transporter ATP-binding protein n=2 Tax=Alkalihalobacillus alcalophilus ATCC 27647 = CGMCC 1.3604 TaxID=1218173 RepID=A0A094WKM0_ALKAL|nr:ABC transporter ATP-binding protein [Alkalihalobacillus alcalophilus]KGA98274.1 ABC transporter ATP-binding protein [Alkalihalobacillus alcalophilus ATCC 27647 = CGMCC 1.3604]MED1561592.1 ABC transporter ATP-binding protein [Alkalihalobacillus alcalophilus]THG89875.1 ABC transporter ATP-binding protein [Alkalihalobacillus alcalophilus ATCC 27647 = CGMCC 1.3604]